MINIEMENEGWIALAFLFKKRRCNKMYMTGYGKRIILYDWNEDTKKATPSLLAFRLINIYGCRWPHC